MEARTSVGKSSFERAPAAGANTDATPTAATYPMKSATLEPL
jgi:hypothetical protein